MRSKNQRFFDHIFLLNYETSFELLYNSNDVLLFFKKNETRHILTNNLTLKQIIDFKTSYNKRNDH